GRLVALAYVAQAAFAPIATFFRGTGRPGFVTIVMAAAGAPTLLALILLIPRFGAISVGYAYLLSSVPWLIGLAYGWVLVFGRSAALTLLSSVGLPMLMGGVAFGVELAILSRFGDLYWFLLLALGTLFAGITTLLVFGADRAQGGDTP